MSCGNTSAIYFPHHSVSAPAAKNKSAGRLERKWRESGGARCGENGGILWKNRAGPYNDSGEPGFTSSKPQPPAVVPFLATAVTPTALKP
ncbi:uncharacterized protein VTP21DRAFT_9741 [Calcarisporiella thermophila]|uniref:uncharacterized protein n=1 Tax=Calcarisporiella thermophila TaxID=911321 RepID=UPI0037430106